MCLSATHKSPGFNPQHSRSKAWWPTPYLGGGGTKIRSSRLFSVKHRVGGQPGLHESLSQIKENKNRVAILKLSNCQPSALCSLPCLINPSSLTLPPSPNPPMDSPPEALKTTPNRPHASKLCPMLPSFSHEMPQPWAPG